MGDDVDDRSSYPPQHYKVFYNTDLGSRQPPQILSRIRNFNQAITSIGTLFSTPTSTFGTFVKENQENPGYAKQATSGRDCEPDLEGARTPNALSGNDRQDNQNYYDAREIKIVDTSTPMPTRSSSPLPSRRFSDVKRIFNFARSHQTDFHGQMHTQLNTATPADLNLTEIPQPYNIMTHRDEGRTSTAISCTMPDCSSSEHLTTPPLTPDSFDDHGLPPLILSDSPTDTWIDFHPEWAKEQPGYYDEEEYPPSNSLEIQEGKRPERPTYQDRSVANSQGRRRTPPITLQTTQNAIQDDEWYGLEYTLELSTRERRPSATQSFSIGEHSKSRESWAALHQGTIHPFFEDEDYYQWKNWHRYLDRQDERRRHRKGWEFRARAKDLAWYYADEMVTRDFMYWQKEVFGVVARDVKERLATLAERRPDPYYPAKKHNRAWYLKRSRSVGSLRELQPVPGHQRTNQDQKQAANLEQEDELVIETENDDCCVLLED